ncbi:MAG TPA: hypothetical protein DCE42_12610 [Myxococcales bacterium]|nr:hypothetical protein [Deltaproteobacteria bacterium]HAA55595.1 hypothetical protein [Myxococcales bacterium]
MINTRHIRGFTLLLVICVFLSGCPHKKTTPEHASRQLLWRKPRALSLFRGLQTGSSVRQAQRVICREWSLGQCRAVEPVLDKKLPEGVHMFAYTPQASPYPCRYELTFHQWGLVRVEWSCRAHLPKQVKAMQRQYKKVYGAPSSTVHFRRQLHVWRNQRTQFRNISLEVQGLKLHAIHEDIRASWLVEAKNIQPENGEVPQWSWKRWEGVPVHLKREVLEHFGRMIYMWRERLKGSSYRALQSKHEWTPPLEKERCRSFAKGSKAWSKAPWTQLDFYPINAHWLHYRLRLLMSSKKRKVIRRIPWATLSVPVRLEARGCGFLFRSEGVLRGKQIYFERIKAFEEES